MSGNQVTAPTRAEFRRIQDCKSLGEAFACPEFLERIKQSAPAHVKPQRMLRTFIQATSRTPDLLKCSMRSVLGAMLTCSEVGLEPNTPLQHAFLIPFARTKWDPVARKRVDMGHEVQLIFGYPGLLDLAYRSGHVTSVHADVVWAAEARDEKRFSFAYGTDAHLRHVPMGHHEDNEKPLWVYAHANLTNGQAFEVMPWADVMRIRNQSQGFQAALRSKEQGENSAKPYIPRSWTDAPWVKHELPMARKTAFRSLWKWLPHSVELAGALALDEQQDRGFVDFGSVLDGSASVMEGGFEEGEAIEVETKDATATFTDRRDTPAQPPVQTGGNLPPTQDQRREEPPVERDSAGVAWDAARHASSKAKNTDGTWRARRGVAAQEASQPAQEPAEDSLPFDRWDQEQPTTIPSAAILEGGKVTPVETSDVDAEKGPSNKDLSPTSAEKLAIPGLVVDARKPAFEAWLVDGEGTEIPDADGVLEAFTDPVLFAEAYVNALANEFPGTIDLFKRANHDSLALAMAASNKVAAILVAGDSPKTVMGAAPVEVDPAFVPAPTANTPAEFKSYLARLEVVLSMEATPDWINRVVDVNAPIYESTQFPPARRMAAKAIVMARQQAISPAQGATQTFNALADGILLDIASLESVGQWDAWRDAAPVMAELESLKAAPDLHTKVMDAADARRSVLIAPTALTPLELFEELKARALACKTTDEAAQLQADKGFLGKVALMHKADATLWPKLQEIAMKHIEAVKAREPTS